MRTILCSGRPKHSIRPGCSLVAVAPYVGNAVFAARLAEESGARARCAGQGVLCVSSTS
ncbi:hypothetical protein ABR737_00045 [Streptomyces sp. Edi2]|uniref:hypothetical protein n=1 Tax=Streptomyces sp. Edi2 TaxID=3162528 RepID=UPI0033059E7F